MPKKHIRSTIIAATAFFVAAAAAAGIYVYIDSRPFAVWYVDEDLQNVWNRVLVQIPPPQQFVAVRPWNADGSPAALSEPGFIITRNRRAVQTANASAAADGQVPVIDSYPRLSFDLQVDGDMVLAVDPWMIFRKHWNGGLSYQRVFAPEGGEGRLLIPGRDAEAVNAWTARLVLGETGSLNAPPEVWARERERLFTGNRFVRGSISFAWSDVYYFLLDNDESAWAYAPLSRIRQLPSARTSSLEATIFPQKEAGGRYSLQADILWARPVGSGKQRKKLEKAAEWLKSAETQTVLADALGWLGADPYAVPFNPVTLNARNAWLSASVVYDIQAP